MSNFPMYNIISTLHPWQKLLLGSTLAMLFCLVGSYDIESEEQEQALYCENVKAKVWPSFDKTILCNQ